jgi:uncharacterized lipoprotein
MARSIPVLVCAAVAVLGGCSSDKGLRCEDTSLYSSSISVPPIRVPDDLSVPDESDSLLIPEAPRDAAALTECLETPPSYFENQGSEER